jgi:hypothetical protein
MQWALDHWDECAPRFADLLEQSAGGGDASKETAEILFFAVHLMAQQEDGRAFEPLCRLACDRERLERIIGEDGITVSLPRLLVGTYDGRSEILKALIENSENDEFVRNSALQAFAFLTHIGKIPLEETRNYLQWLQHSMQPREENFAFVGIADAIINLGLTEYRSVVEDLLARGLISDSVMHLGNFDTAIERTLADPERRAGFTSDHIEPCTDVIADMSTWYWFSEAAEQDEIRAERYRKEQAAQKFAAALANSQSARSQQTVLPLGPERQAAAQPSGPAAVSGKVGRNDPCPCGSGKKFKKCCLQ